MFFSTLLYPVLSAAVGGADLDGAIMRPACKIPVGTFFLDSRREFTLSSAWEKMNKYQKNLNETRGFLNV
jgi:hypothetical protein